MFAGRRLVLALGVVVLLGSCSPPSDSGQEGGEHATAMGHIHGIGVDPADDTLYAATHFGLFRFKDGGATRVADRWQDTMAFTVVGRNHFLGSGHPDLTENLPSHLGLIESTDSGETWAPLALQGKADFHALEPAGDLLYGAEAISGTVMVTEDRRTFDAVVDLQAADLAAEPGRPQHVLATLYDGTLMSVDAATDEAATMKAPALAFVDWPTDSELVGLGPDGSVHLSNDHGDTWQRVGAIPGPGAALEVTEEKWYAATQGQLFVSDDAGRSWSGVITGQSDS